MINKYFMTSCLRKKLKNKKELEEKITKSKLYSVINNRDWSRLKEPARATVFAWNKTKYGYCTFRDMVNKDIDWEGDFGGGLGLSKDYVEKIYREYRPTPCKIISVHNKIAMWLHNKGAKHGDLVLSPSEWWDNVDDISNVYRIYTVKKGVPTIEFIGSDIASYLNEDEWAENEPIIGFSSSDIKYSLGPNYPVGYWAGAPETQNLSAGGPNSNFLRLEPVAAKYLYTNFENPVDVTVDDLTYEDGFSTLNLEWGGLQFPGEPKDVVRQLIMYHTYENNLSYWLRYWKDVSTEKQYTSTDIITQIRKNAGFKKQQILTNDGNYVMSHQPETLRNYGLNNSYHTEGRILFTYMGKTKLGQPIGRVLRLSDLGYHNTNRLSVWDEVITIDRATEALKHQLIEIDSRWTIDKLEDISYTELYTMVNEHPTNLKKKLEKNGFEDEEDEESVECMIL